MVLTTHQHPAKSGTAKELIIFVHGYGADGADLLGLSQPLAPLFPDAVFIAPDAPTRCEMNPMGFQWFPIPWLDGSDPIVAGQKMHEAFDIFEQWLDRLQTQMGIPASKTVLFGFSQGTMMSLSVGLRMSQSLAGIVGFSGRLLEPENLSKLTTPKPPIQLIHGDADEVVPFSDMARAETALQAADYEVSGHTMQGMGHGISPDGLEVAATFMSGVLSS